MNKDGKKIAFVTGGARGIGRAIVEKLGMDGYIVGFNYVNSKEESEAFVQSLKERGIQSFCLRFDVSDYETCESELSAFQKENGTIDVLVNNAGITKDKLFIRMKEADFEDVIDINLKGVFNVTKQVANKMMKQKSGRIINLSSIAGLIGNIGQVNYSASKAGVIGMTRTLAAEFGGYGVTVNAIAPGFIKTDMTDVLPEDIKEKIIDMVPLKTMGYPEDVADMVSFLAGDSGRYITGQVISIDGGLSAI
ncbi:MAG: 3-oxoacyl-[acyl-carrier-protein] reductase [Bacillota bacterium]|nr:3-oxoacyl-[acyl-carrier-protein] reductase [Bacillota bacterium]